MEFDVDADGCSRYEIFESIQVGENSRTQTGPTNNLVINRNIIVHFSNCNGLPGAFRWHFYSVYGQNLNLKFD